jgi:ArsR family transcriptional regulator
MNTDLVTAGPPDGLRAAAEPLRWRILTLLAREELCVCHLVEALDVPQSLISHHLRALRAAGLVETERFRYWTYYRLRPEALAELGQQLVDLAGGVPAPGSTRRPCC